MIEFSIKIPKNTNIAGLDSLFDIKPNSLIKEERSNFQLLLWGDPIYNEDTIEAFNNKLKVKYIVENIFGHYYFLLWNKKDNEISFGNSLFGILPIYYKMSSNELIAGNHPKNLDTETSHKFNKRFILENILFNYPLFNISYLEDIDLLKTNHFFNFSEGSIKEINHTSIESLYETEPKPWKKCTKDAANTFIKSIEKYFPDEQYHSALTGGFDGRTLIANGISNNKTFKTFSFGKQDSPDVQIAKNVSKNLNIEYKHYSLNKEYVSKSSLINGQEFINNSAGTAGFARAHYLYACKLQAKEANYILTGNFGSEVFRAAHIPGAVISPNLYNLFNANSYDEAIKLVEQSNEWLWVNKESFSNEWDAIKEDLRTFPAFDKNLSGLTKNQKFYKVVFDEVFRKYFGAEMVNQFKFLRNRTPYLDYSFLKEVLSTGFAGVHSDFFTHNPLKRFKGQVLYAHIIKQTSPELLKHRTDKGYKPGDLLSLWGKAQILNSFIKKRVHRNKKTDIDPYAVKEAFQFNKKNWLDYELDERLFNKEHFHNCIKNNHFNNSLVIAFSQSWWYNKNKKEV